MIVVMPQSSSHDRDEHIACTRTSDKELHWILMHPLVDPMRWDKYCTCSSSCAQILQKHPSCAMHPLQRMLAHKHCSSRLDLYSQALVNCTCATRGLAMAAPTEVTTAAEMASVLLSALQERTEHEQDSTLGFV